MLLRVRGAWLLASAPGLLLCFVDLLEALHAPLPSLPCTVLAATILVYTDLGSVCDFFEAATEPGHVSPISAETRNLCACPVHALIGLL